MGSEVGRHRSTQSILGWMEHCEGRCRDQGQVLEGLTAGWRDLNCLWVAGRAVERGTLSAGVFRKIPLVAVWTDRGKLESERLLRGPWPRSS